MNPLARLSLLLGTGLALSACARPPETSLAAMPVSLTPSTQATAVAADTLPRVLVHKSPTCGCCGLWVEHLRQAGFPVEVRDQENIHPIKERLGIPFGKGSCHTAQVDGYVIEGHVPVQDIKRLLAERPQARGLVLPGMPAGSPGMEMPDGRVEPYTVELIATDGSSRPFARHGSAGSP
ncbi:MAG: DUF411 domain-containing protein [Lysobacter sp.]|nr:DUF411 domain-containing protein [Lysobacter sp.]